MKNYELLYIVSHGYTEKELPKIRGKVNSLIEKNGGVIGLQEFLGKKKLAYPIDKILHGYYIVTEFELEDATKVKNINTELKLDKEVLRALIISKPKLSEEEKKKQNERRVKKEFNSTQSDTKIQNNEETKQIDTAESTPPTKKKSVTITESEEQKIKEEKKEALDAKTTNSGEKIKMEDLDEKLDEILNDDNII